MAPRPAPLPAKALRPPAPPPPRLRRGLFLTATIGRGLFLTAATVACISPLAAAFSAWPLAAAGPVARGRPTIAAGTWPITATWTAVATGTKRLLAVATAEIHAVLRAVTDVVAFVEFVGDVLVVVADPVSMIDVVVPVIANVVNVDGAIDVDVVVAPAERRRPGAPPPAHRPTA